MVHLGTAFAIFYFLLSFVASTDDGINIHIGGPGSLVTYKVATVQIRPFYYPNRDKGLCVDILDKLASFVNFRYELFAYPMTEGVWQTLTYKLANGEFDMIVAPYGPTESRKKLVDFVEDLMVYLPWVLLNKKYDGINSLEDLLNSHLKIGAVKSSSVEEVLKTSKGEGARALYKRIQRDKSYVSNVRDGIRKARNEEYAFIIDSPIAEYQMDKKPCDLKIIGTDADASTYAVALRKGQGWLKNDLALATQFLQETEYVETRLRHYLTQTAQCYSHARSLEGELDQQTP